MIDITIKSCCVTCLHSIQVMDSQLARYRPCIGAVQNWLTIQNTPRVTPGLIQRHMETKRRVHRLELGKFHKTRTFGFKTCHKYAVKRHLYVVGAQPMRPVVCNDEGDYMVCVLSQNHHVDRHSMTALTTSSALRRHTCETPFRYTLHIIHFY